MIREEFLRRLVDDAYVDLYLSATDGARMYWPWRMQPVHEADTSHRNACERYVIDSSFQDESITNRDALDKAHELNAEMCVLADVWHDKEATVDAILAGLELYDDHPYDGQVIAPLQPPHGECYMALEGQGIDVFAIGGVKDAGDTAKLEGSKDVRANAGPDAHIHGLGFGMTDTMVQAIQDQPGLLDSVDYSTPVQNAINYPATAGEERMSVVSARACAQLVEDLRDVSSFVKPPEPEDLRRSDQAGLDQMVTGD